MNARAHNFDCVARPYRLLEYLTMGKALEQTRFHFVNQLRDARHVLVFGDGDGRFLEQLFRVNGEARVTAIDSSGEMLRLLRERCLPYEDRLTTIQCDASAFVANNVEQYDLVATHFFLDCLQQDELNSLVEGLRPHLQPGALWVLSEFRIPFGVMRLPSWALVRGLYLAFRILTGLKASHLPDYASPLSQAGFMRTEQKLFLGGALTAELWRLP